MSDIGRRLREERVRLGLTQQAFAARGGVASNAQGNYESGKRKPKADYLAALAEKGVDILYVLLGEPQGLALDFLTDKERSVMQHYRLLNDGDQDAIDRLSSSLSSTGGVRESYRY